MRTALLVVALGGVVLFSGCSYQDFKRPTVRNYFGDAFYQPEKPFEPVRADVASQEQATIAVARWQEMSQGVTDEYVVGSGDLLKVLLYIPSQPSANVSIDLLVSKDGTIDAPLVGRIAVGGLSVPGISDKLSKLYADGYFKSPLVSVTVGEYHSKQIFVSGCVMKPGVVALSSNRTTLVEAILEAGGVAERAGEDVIVTRMAPSSDGSVKPESVRLSLVKLLNRSGVGANLWVLPGDVINVPELVPKYFYVLGYVNTPGAYPVPKDGMVSLMQAVACAHGLTDSAHAENTSLVRQTPLGEKRYQIDMTRVAAGTDADIRICPDDKIIIGTTGVRRFLDGFLRAAGFRSLAPAY